MDFIGSGEREKDLFDYPNLYVCPAPSKKIDERDRVRFGDGSTISCRSYRSMDDVDSSFCDICDVEGISRADIDAGRCGLYRYLNGER